MSDVRIARAAGADRPAWDAFVASRPEGDPLQLWAWGDVREPDGERPVRLVARGDDGRVRGVASLLVRPTSFGRAVGYVPHGPLWEREAPDGDALLRALVRGIRAAARAERVIVAKLDPRATTPDDGPGLRARLLEAGLRPASRDLQAPRTSIIDLLDGAEALWKTWDSAARNQARRAVREGVTVAVDRGGDPDAIAAFHAILRATSDRGGFRIHPAEHFQRLAAGLAPAGGWYLVLASHDGRTISGAVMLRVADRAYYLYGGSLRDRELRSLYGSNAVMAEAMRVLAADGVRTLDLWGVAARDDPDADPAWTGFSEFKRQFGGTAIRHPGTFDLVVDRAWDLVRSLRERGMTAARRALGRGRPATTPRGAAPRGAAPR